MPGSQQGKQSWFQLLKSVFKEFGEDDCTRLAAALAYFTVFSLPALLVFTILIAGAVFGEEAVRGEISTQMESMLGAQAADQIEEMIANSSDPTQGGGIFAIVVGIVTLLFGASRAFVELQAAMNKVWEVEPDPERGGIKKFIFKRLLSFGMVLTIGFLLLVSLILSAAVSAFGHMLAGPLPEGLAAVLLEILNIVVSFLVIWLLFAAIYKIMPDVEIAWRDVWVGAAVGTGLFVVGKFAIGLYLGNADIGSSYGAAGSLAVILIWIYYSAIILFLGAEFTQVWARAHGRRLRPSEGAVAVKEEKVRISGAHAAPSAG